MGRRGERLDPRAGHVAIAFQLHVLEIERLVAQGRGRPCVGDRGKRARLECFVAQGTIARQVAARRRDVGADLADALQVLRRGTRREKIVPLRGYLALQLASQWRRRRRLPRAGRQIAVQIVGQAGRRRLSAHRRVLCRGRRGPRRQILDRHDFRFRRRFRLGRRFRFGCRFRFRRRLGLRSGGRAPFQPAAVAARTIGGRIVALGVVGCRKGVALREQQERQGRKDCHPRQPPKDPRWRLEVFRRRYRPL